MLRLTVLLNMSLMEANSRRCSLVSWESFSSFWNVIPTQVWEGDILQFVGGSEKRCKAVWIGRKRERGTGRDVGGWKLLGEQWLSLGTWCSTISSSAAGWSICFHCAPRYLLYLSLKYCYQREQMIVVFSLPEEIKPYSVSSFTVGEFPVFIGLKSKSLSFSLQRYKGNGISL